MHNRGKSVDEAQSPCESSTPSCALDVENHIDVTTRCCGNRTRPPQYLASRSRPLAPRRQKVSPDRRDTQENAQVRAGSCVTWDTLAGVWTSITPTDARSGVTTGSPPKRTPAHHLPDTMSAVTSGKRAGSRRAEKATPTLNVATLGHVAGITACVIAWGYLVFSAVDFGGSARGGNDAAWLMLALAGIGAAACLFVGLMLGLRLLVSLGISRHPDAPEPETPRPVGGRRAAR